jgi:hypothetical protein
LGLRFDHHGYQILPVTSVFILMGIFEAEYETKLCGLSPRANYTDRAEYEGMVKEVKAKTISAVVSIPEEKKAAFMKHFRNHQKIDSNADKHMLKIFNVPS